MFLLLVFTIVSEVSLGIVKITKLIERETEGVWEK